MPRECEGCEAIPVLDAAAYRTLIRRRVIASRRAASLAIRDPAGFFVRCGHLNMLSGKAAGTEVQASG